MASFIWNREPQEALDNPYEYGAQEQFVREANTFLSMLSDEMSNLDMTFTLEEQSARKAIWMLQNDALDSLKDILKSLQEKKHRIAGKLFRDIIETLDLAAYFYSNSIESNKNLAKWYADEIISHSIYRDFIKKELGEQYANQSRDNYKIISKFTHRTYKILLYSYVLGKEDRISYDGYKENDILVLPHTISMYYAILADFIKMASIEFASRGLLTNLKIEEIWKASIEPDTIPRRFISPKEIFARHKKEKKQQLTGAHRPGRTLKFCPVRRAVLSQ